MPNAVIDKTTPPAGVLPPKLRYVLVAVIAGLILITSFFSGRTAKRGSDVPTAAVPSSAAQSQLAAFTKMLESQRLEAERLKREADAVRLAEEQKQALAPRLTPQYYAAPEPRPVSATQVDPLEQRRRERDELAPFASNIALVVATPEVRPAESTKAGPVTIPERSTAATAPLPEVTKATGSGRFLPEKENGLYRVYEGTFIETTLANRLDGSFTGPVKCIVSRDLRSKNGEAVLIPKGSQFFGEARRVESAGQTRLAVTFKRLLLPNGYSVDLENAPGLNKEGETGLKDRTNNHYLKTFGLSGAVGLLGGLALYGGRGTGYEYATGVANTEGSAATTILNRSLNLLPTITIREGHTVNVYLPADLQLPEYRP